MTLNNNHGLDRSTSYNFKQIWKRRCDGVIHLLLLLLGTPAQQLLSNQGNPYTPGIVGHQDMLLTWTNVSWNRFNGRCIKYRNKRDWDMVFYKNKYVQRFWYCPLYTHTGFIGNEHHLRPLGEISLVGDPALVISANCVMDIWTPGHVGKHIKQVLHLLWWQGTVTVLMEGEVGYRLGNYSKICQNLNNLSNSLKHQS